jgi:hypothetical protein
MVTLRSRPRLVPQALARRWSPEPRAWWLCLVIACGVGTPLIVAAFTGNLTIPHNDSWAYSRIAETLWRTGHLRLLNYNDMSLIGQVVMLGPLGRWLAVQQVAVAVLGAIAVWCCYALVRPAATTGRALLAASVLVLWPGFANLTTSFMTDVPALAASFLTLVVGRRALQQDSRRLLALSLLIGLFGATIRENTLVAPAAVVIVGLWTHRTRSAVTAKYLIAATALLGVFVLAFLDWRGTLPYGQDPQLAIHLAQLPSQLLDDSEAAYFTASTLLAPLALFMARPWRWRWPSWVAVAVVVTLAIRMGLTHHGFILDNTGDNFAPTGEYQYIIGGTRTVISAGLWRFLTPIAIVGGLALAGELTAQWRRADPVVATFTVLSFVAVIAVAVAYWPLFDRYLIPLIPGLAGPILTTGRRHGAELPHRRRTIPALMERLLSPVLPIAGVASFVVVALISAMLALNAFAFDAARWQTGSMSVAAGVPAGRVDAGMEWDGWHSPGALMNYPWISKLHGYFDYAWEFYPSPPCVVVATSPAGLVDPGSYQSFTLVAKIHYDTYLVTGSSYLYVYATHLAGCPARVTTAGQ